MLIVYEEESAFVPAAPISRPKDLAPCSDRIVGLRPFDHPSWKSPSSRCMPIRHCRSAKPSPVLIAGTIVAAVPGSSCCNWATPALSFVRRSQCAGRGSVAKAVCEGWRSRANEASRGHPYAVLSRPLGGLRTVGRAFGGRLCSA